MAGIFTPTRNISREKQSKQGIPDRILLSTIDPLYQSVNQILTHIAQEDLKRYFSKPTRSY